MGNDRHKYEFILLNLIILFITQFSSVFIAYFDASGRSPTVNILTGFYNWAFSYLTFSPAILAYLIIRKNKNLLSVYAALISFLAVVLYASHPLLFPEVIEPSLFTIIQ